MRWNLLSLFPTASINRYYTFKKGNYEILKKELDIDNQAFIEKFELDLYCEYVL